MDHLNIVFPNAAHEEEEKQKKGKSKGEQIYDQKRNFKRMNISGSLLFHFYV